MAEAFGSKEQYIRRIAIFTEGVNAKEIPIPTAMKGSFVIDFKVCKVNLLKNNFKKMIKYYF